MSKKKFKRPLDIKAAMNKSVEGVGRHAFHVICKVLSDGLPPDDKAGNALWRSYACENQLGNRDAKKVAKLALGIEHLAKVAILKLFLTPGFMDNLMDSMVAKHARGLQNSRKPGMTEIWRKYFQREGVDKNLSIKKAVQVLESEEVLILDLVADCGYLINPDLTMDQWDKIPWSTIKSSYTRVRKELYPK